MPDAPWPADAVEVARVTGAWGVKGWIKLHPLGRDAQALLEARDWHLRLAAPAPGTGESALPLRIRQARRHGDAIVAWPESFAERAQAEALRGAQVFVSRAAFPAAGADEYYWVDLIGAQVVNRQGETLGTVTALADTGAHDVLCVRRPGATNDQRDAEQLIPFVSAYVDKVDLGAHRIVVDWGSDY
ncbi:MAG: ribosome maturation factor RimM [Burkholderiaceae bacterium]